MTFYNYFTIAFCQQRTPTQELEEALDLPLANFAWTRDQYAKVFISIHAIRNTYNL